jgi:hypothetical protein
MKSIAILLVVAVFQCFLLRELNCYTLRDSDLIPARFLRRADQYQLEDLMLMANNRQKSLYSEAEGSLAAGNSYQEALETIAAAAAAQNHQASVADEGDDEESLGGPQQGYSEELHLDDFIQDEGEEEDGEFRVDPKDEETESHSSLIAGHQYVSGSFFNFYFPRSSYRPIFPRSLTQKLDCVGFFKYFCGS